MAPTIWLIAGKLLNLVNSPVDGPFASSMQRVTWGGDLVELPLQAARWVPNTPRGSPEWATALAMSPELVPGLEQHAVAEILLAKRSSSPPGSGPA